MNRLFASPISGALIGLLLAGTALAADARIRPEATVSTDTVRLGNLVEGLEQGGDIPLFKAPAPGARGTIRVARKNPRVSGPTRPRNITTMMTARPNSDSSGV